MDGRLKDIKKAYKNNVFNISVHVNGQAEEVLNQLKDDYNVKQADYNYDDHLMDLKIQLPSNETQSILSWLSSKGNILHFEETTPSVSDIFIKAVEEAN